MRTSPADLERIIQDIFVVTLGLDCHPGGRRADVPATDVRPTVTGVVQISGDWRGALAVHLSPALADRAAATMFDLEPSRLAPADVRDAVGEIVNVAGGNFKSLLDGACALSLPVVTEGASHEFSVRGTVTIDVLAFTCMSEPVTASIHEQR